MPSTTDEGTPVDADRLKAISIFSDLAEEDLRIIAALASEVSVPEGKELVREGDFSYDVLAIEQGTAEVLRGGEHVADLGEGDVVGEMGVLTRQQRNATVRATSPMMLITLDRWDVKRLERRTPAAVEHLKAVLAERSGGSSS